MSKKTVVNALGIQIRSLMEEKDEPSGANESLRGAKQEIFGL